jgi:hypothetical protein
MDLASGYWQVKMHPRDMEKTTFNSKWGSFFFLVMPFGLVKAPATFQSLMDKIFGDIQWKHVCVYFDDIFIFSKTFKEHLQHIEEVLSRLRRYKLQAKIQKCNFIRQQIRFLGHLVSAEGISPDPAKIEAITKWRTPRSKRDVRSFVGLCSYYRRFIRHFASKAHALHRLQSSNKTVKFEWGPPEQASMDSLKEALISAPVLISPDWNAPFTLQTDSSDYGVGAVLCQGPPGHEQVIAYASKSLNKHQ